MTIYLVMDVRDFYSIKAVQLIWQSTRFACERHRVQFPAPPMCVCFEILGLNPQNCKDLQDTPSNIKLDHEPKDFKILGLNPQNCKDLQDTPSNIKLDHEPKDFMSNLSGSESSWLYLQFLQASIMKNPWMVILAIYGYLRHGRSRPLFYKGGVAHMVERFACERHRVQFPAPSLLCLFR